MPSPWNVHETESRLLRQFGPLVPPDLIRACVAVCRRDLGLFDHNPALPELLERLARVRLTALVQAATDQPAHDPSMYAPGLGATRVQTMPAARGAG